ncbi:hypothetical protein JCM10295v2_003281 [Rhodotorula toruloides]
MLDIQNERVLRVICQEPEDDAGAGLFVLPDQFPPTWKPNSFVYPQPYFGNSDDNHPASLLASDPFAHGTFCNGFITHLTSNQLEEGTVIAKVNNAAIGSREVLLDETQNCRREAGLSLLIYEGEALGIFDGLEHEHEERQVR